MSATMRPFSWLRFIDDIGNKWLHARENLDAFLREAKWFGYINLRKKMTFGIQKNAEINANLINFLIFTAKYFIFDCKYRKNSQFWIFVNYI